MVCRICYITVCDEARATTNARYDMAGVMTNLQEKIKIAESRIEELQLLIKHWKKQDEEKLRWLQLERRI